MRATSRDGGRSGASDLVAYLRAKRQAWLGASPADAFRGRWMGQDGSAHEFAADCLRVIERGTTIEYRGARTADFTMTYRWGDLGEMRALFPDVAALDHVDCAGARLPALRVRSGRRETSYVIVQPRTRMLAIAAGRWMYLGRAG